MELIRHSDGRWSLARVSELEYLMLSRIQESADPSGCDQALERLYPSPVAPTAQLDHEAALSIEEDWREYTGPEIRDGFSQALEKVALDIASASVEDDEGYEYYGMTLPDAHAESWCSALNQARLVLHHRHELPEEAEEMGVNPVSEEWIVVLQSEIYGMIMEFLIKEVLWDQ
ncbi:MAG: DUF2017 domain-containing protein [Verrucomicrobiales bacterium]|nr:DUF2017 domain-containing protein [Verrucomicrobiales bacterium]MED5585003.1 DUF2017 family protein [Verrucomicrobiota bacterium]